MKKLISLKEHDEERRNFHDNVPILNGIACPVCEEELYDSSPRISLMSSPPKKHVHCRYCFWKGYRFA